MRIVLAILLSCLPGLGAGMGWNKPFERAEAGYLVFDTFERSTVGDDWWNRGTATVNMYDSNMLTYALSGVIITNYVMFTNWYTACENFTAEWDQTPIATNSTTSGVYFAMRAASTSPTRTIWAGVYLASDADAGRAMIGKNDNASFTIINKAPTGRAITGYGGVPISVRVSVTNNVWHCFATNPANGTYTHTNTTLAYAESGNLTPVASYFAFNILAGSNLIDNFRITLNVRPPTQLLIVEKSIGNGSAATNESMRYARQVFASADWPSYVNAGGADATTNWQRRIREFDMYRPLNTWIGFPSDIIQGVASNTWAPNLALLVGTLRTNGHTVNVMASQPNNTADQTPHNLYVSNSVGFINCVIYAGWTGLRTNASSAHPPFYHADLIHPNHIGHTNIGDALRARYLRP